MNITFGMATYNDFDGTYFTVQNLRMFHMIDGDEVLVIDNFGCDHTKEFVEMCPNARYVRSLEVQGTSAPRDLVFREARNPGVMCLDSHVMLAPGAGQVFRAYLDAHPECTDLIQGPMLSDALDQFDTQWDPVWRDLMFGTWSRDDRGDGPDLEAFEIPSMGLGVFGCMKSAWAGFNPLFRGFGGEEGYIQEKFRLRGDKTLCLPGLKWLHRFPRPMGIPYTVTLDDRLRNYILGWEETGQDMSAAISHFREWLVPTTIAWIVAGTLEEAGVQDRYDIRELLRISGVDLDSDVERVLQAKGVPKESGEPVVTCVIITDDARQLSGHKLDDLVDAFRKQTFEGAELLIFNNSGVAVRPGYLENVRILTPSTQMTTVEQAGRLVLLNSRANYVATWNPDRQYPENRLASLLENIGELDGLEEAAADGEAFSGLLTRKAYESLMSPIDASALAGETVFNMGSID